MPTDTVSTELRTYRLVHKARPWTANGERRLHPMARAALVREWRTAFWILAKETHVPPMDRIAITAMPVQRNQASRPDVGACYGAVKAAIDGLVDAGVVPNDTPDHVIEIRFTAPAIGSADQLVLVIQEVAGWEL